jgi:hypothetical protein
MGSTSYNSFSNAEGHHNGDRAWRRNHAVFAAAFVATCIACPNLYAQDEHEDPPSSESTTDSGNNRGATDPRFIPSEGMRPRAGQRGPGVGRDGGSPMRDDGGRPGRDGPPFQRLSDGERANVEAFINEHFPVLAVELDRVRQNNPRVFERRMARIAPEILRLMEVFQRDPQQGALLIRERRLDMELRLLGMRFRHANNDADRQRVRAQMGEAASELFDIRHERRAGEIRTLESRIRELKERHDQAARMREQTIEREVRDRLNRPFPGDSEEE